MSEYYLSKPGESSGFGGTTVTTNNGSSTWQTLVIDQDTGEVIRSTIDKKDKDEIIISILGTDYTVKYVPEYEDEMLSDCGGYIDVSTREIIVPGVRCKKQNMLGNVEDTDKVSLRHEIIHAFFHESGLWTDSNMGTNETLVDWIAIQFPKLYNAFKEVEAL